ncbi:MAG: LytR C-terminal domain-containing protein [Patescibacteria group bacterium]
MRVKQSGTKSRGSLKVLGIFCGIVLVAIIASLFYRLIGLMETSKYDSSHTFLLAFAYKSDLDIFALRPHGEMSSHLIIRGAPSLSVARQTAGVIPDTIITLPKSLGDLEQVSRVLFDGAIKGGLKTDLTSYDLMRLSYTTKRFPPRLLQTEELQVPKGGDELSPPQDFFSDQVISQENKSIAIINGTGIPGLGTRLEEAIVRLGGNVISVTNASEDQDHSQISYTGEKSYTVTHLSLLFGISPTLSAQAGLSDIIVLIGKDKSSIIPY